MLQRILLLVLFLSPLARAADNLVIVTIDGLRWQEVYRGYDQSLLDIKDITPKPDVIVKAFGASSADQRRQKLMPFLWQTVAKQGVMLGNRDLNSAMAVSNSWWFSYPGYNEILTGAPDRRIDSNDYAANPNITLLEWLNQQPGFSGKVAAFASWDAFGRIINASRSQLPVNDGFVPASWPAMSEKAQWLNQLLASVPTPWDSVRFDAITMGLAQEYLRQQQPRVMFISLGETDDFAHDADYQAYLQAAHRDDQLLQQLWQQLQSLPQYRNNTNLLITVDHGRGEGQPDWQHHGSAEATLKYTGDPTVYPQGIVGSNQVWFAAIGPDIKALGEMQNTPELSTKQIARTALATLQQDGKGFNPEAGAPMTLILKP